MARSRWEHPTPRGVRLLDAFGPVFGMLVIGLGGLVVPTSVFGWCITVAALTALPLAALRARSLLAAERFVSAATADRYRTLVGLLDELGPGQQQLFTAGGLILAVNEKIASGSSLRQYLRLDSTQETTATGAHLCDLYTLDADRPVVHHELRVTATEADAGDTMWADLRRRPIRTVWRKLRLEMQLTRTGIDLVGIDELDVLIAQVREGVESR